MTESLVFLFCILSVCTAVTTCLSSKIIRSTFFFGVTLFLIAFIFIVVGSTLLGIIQILLYTGGTLVLFLFSIFLTGNWDYNNLGETFSRPILAITISFIFFITLSFLISESQTFIDLEKNFNLNSIASTKNVSKNFAYEMDVDINNIKWDTNNIQAIGTQRNTETGVVREIRFVRNQKPKQKTIENFTSVIEKTMGKHDGVWLNNVDAITRFEQDMGNHKTIKHNEYNLLGCFKLARADNKKALQDRLAYYKSHGIECSIKKLFHGTYQQNLYPIIHPMGGFAMASETNGKAYGQGIYFGIDPKYCINNGYAPPENDRLRCVIACDVIVGKKLDNGTDSSLKNASVRTGSSSNSVTFNPKDFELTGGSSSGSITVVFYDKIQTDIHITDVLWYR